MNKATQEWLCFWLHGDKSCPYPICDFLLLQESEQYLTDSQFLAQDFLQVISFLQTIQILLGKELLLPLNDVLGIVFTTH